MNYQRSSKKNEAFTFIETLVSIVVISIITSLIYFCCSSAIKNIYKARTLTSADLKIIESDNKLRSIINSVSVPDWETDFEIKFTSRTITLRWVEGRDEDFIYEMDPDIEVDKCSVLQYRNGKISGIKIEYLYNGQRYECSQLFSSIPFGQIEL